LSLVQSTCDIDSGVEFQRTCIDGNCIPAQGSPPGTGVCTCERGSYSSNDRMTCVADHYNDTCTTDTDPAECNINSDYMECNVEGGRCECIGEGEDTLYVPGTGCVTKASHKCELIPNCVKDAECIEEKVCRCAEGYAESSSHPDFCSPLYGSSCSNTTTPYQCHSDIPGLTCLTDRYSSTGASCQCIAEGTSFEWSVSENACIGLVGTECTSNSNSTCTPTSYCGPGWGSEFLCQCTDDSLETKDHHCGAAYGFPCGDSSHKSCHADSGLTCGANGTCHCNPNTLYDPTSKYKCLALVGTNCDLRQSGEQVYLNCISPMTTCTSTNTSEPGQGLCSCTRNLIPSNDRTTCVTDHYRDSCSSDAECTGIKFMECNKTRGECQCQGEGQMDMSFDSSTRTCIGNSGGACNTTIDCTPHASCEDKSCECDEGFMPVPSNHKCLMTFNSECNYYSDCNREVGLECVLAYSPSLYCCLCSESNPQYDPDSEWSVREQACMGFVGEECKPLCTPGATCSGFYCWCS
jgi:hypothetical protein